MRVQHQPKQEMKGGEACHTRVLLLILEEDAQALRRPPTLMHACSHTRAFRASKDPAERLDAVLASLVDVPTIMQTMPNAIRKAVQISTVQ
eukprot:765559-Pelagomonas_calceolata.AAC.2